MSAIAQAVDVFRARARAGRASVFRNHFRLGPDSKVLDIGSEDGTSIAAVLQGVGVPPGNIYIADIDRDQVVRGHELFGFTPVVIPEFGHLPFEDGFFDVVYCSSVIEHVTLPKSEVWAVASGREFRRISDERQAEFAREIRRLGRGYFVQTPDRWFPIESHTWLPLVGYLPRRVLLPLLRFSNRTWVKQTSPDWRLLGTRQMQQLFPDARIVPERVWGITKSIMAIKGLK